MKNVKGFVIGLTMGLALAISSLAFAQNPAQTDAVKSNESCCAMSSCCCCSDSCAKHGAKHESKDQAAKEGCCCGGDSCDMTMKQKHNQHQTN